MLRVRDAMTREVATLGPEASVAQAWEILRERGVRHIPVVEGTKVVGLVSDRDLRDASPVRKSDSGEDENVFGWASMRDIMTTNPHTIDPLDTIEHAAQEIYENKFGCLPVVSEGELVGIITSSDMMRVMIELFGAEKPGTWLEIEVSDKPGALAGITDTIRDNSVNLSSVFVAPGHAVSDKLIILRADTTNPKNVIGKLEDAGYSVEVVGEASPIQTSHQEK